MAETISVGSRVALAMQIRERDPNPEKPGESPELRSVVLNGARHPNAINGEGITRDVPADLFRAWVKDNPNHPAVLGEMLREVSETDIEGAVKAEAEFGVEPGLKDVDQKSPEPAQPDDSPRSVPGNRTAKPKD